MRRRLSIAALLTAVTVASLGLASHSPVRASERAAASPTPLLAYYYIWFTPSSWSRGKRDYPLLGRYASDDARVMRQHIRWAKAAGISGFLVSWKSTPALDDRLARLVRVADSEHFHLGIVYEGLDFKRRPLPLGDRATRSRALRDDLRRDKAFAIFERPLLIWSGTWRYTNAQIRLATRNVRSRLLVLASAKNVKDYARVAALFDGEAYYWSSVNPRRHPTYGAKLRSLGVRPTTAVGSGSRRPRRASTRARSAAGASSAARAVTRCARSWTPRRLPRPMRSG